MLSVPILMYHRIGRRKPGSIVADQYVSKKLFAKHLKLLAKDGYRTISLSEMHAVFQGTQKVSGKPIVITFDDGYESFFTEAAPLLSAAGMKATVFLVASCIGKTNRWDEAKGDVSERLMSREQVLNAARQGFEFGAHSLNHPDLRFCDDGMAEQEIRGCRNRLQDSLQLPIDWFCYPYGKHRTREHKFVEQAGYIGACGTGKGSNAANSNIFALNRINVRASTFPAYLRKKISRATG